jgi:methanogenic corrinoid protein MtbC1
VAFLRVKRIRGRDYAYLVESKWDPERHTSRQTTIKYVGPVDEVRLEDVPSEYRDDRVKAFILQHAADADNRRQGVVSDFRERFLKALIAGDRVKTSLVAEEARGFVGLDSFYVEVLTPSMHAIGDMWKKGELTVSMEHLASNIIGELLDSLNARIRVTRKPRGTAVLCTPQGEMHSLASKVLEGLLLERGHRSWNIAASAPTDSIVDFIASKKPDLVLVSLTIPQYLPSLKRLLNAVQQRKIRARILLGGQGLREISPESLPHGTLAVTDGSLDALDRACGVRHQSS